MTRLTCGLDEPYDILIGKNMLSDAGNYVGNVIPPCRVALVTDSTVTRLYAGTVTESLSEAGYDVVLLEFPAGEENKTLATYSVLQDELAHAGLTRSDLIVALGGGVTGDLAGFLAATYLRGIKYIQIPTTYLACVDSSVGGKTGVDLASGKNLCGAFWQPRLVLADYDAFRTLPPSEFLNGTAEAYKTAWIANAELIDHVVKAISTVNHDEISLSEISDEFGYVIEHSIEVKKSVVEEDERDTGARQLLNFGHTFGHAIEKLSAYSTPHGYAVARGMVMESRAAYHLGFTDTDYSGKITDDLHAMGFDLDVPYSAEDLAKAAGNDKKMRSDSITVVVPAEIGRCELRKIEKGDLGKYIEAGIA